MLDLAWTEMVVVALVAIVVVGPKELPRVLRTIGQGVRKLQSMARDFHRSLNDMACEADLEDFEKEVDGHSAEPLSSFEDELGPEFTPEGEDVETHLEDAASEAGAAAPEAQAGVAADSEDEAATEDVAERPAGEAGGVRG